MTENIKPQHPMDNWLRQDRLPHIWCPGCGIGVAFSSLISALQELNIPKNDYAIVSGIGCSSRAAGYIDIDSFHTTHGRAIPFATGLKLVKPNMKVFLFAGDGDLFSIGGNHFIHAARRNVDLTVICLNNHIYGMTGGQFSPGTPYGAITSTSPYGNEDTPFNFPHLADAAGAVFVARWTSAHPLQLKQAIKKALNIDGFSFIEVIGPCPTVYGRRNRQPLGVQMMKNLKETSVINNKASGHELDIELGKPIIIGNFVERQRETFVQRQKAFQVRMDEWFEKKENQKDED
ncbi:MAG: 2-oxoacid:ferredoxin oxidoreductase subunit beta [Planctomycetes bacterium]|jgi:2-oxoglutarate ferredoxin oxidoreductase subunit beta|nr:2-oxoacid:ferredoxin oxidoreductase subunit beta [Planctomycetota bacterium]HON43782.1 thiamine pyrophosphate-dependent enzyme [Planctomycetota bacterium]HPY75466.1 thiamine pyrophosphate-dependent enzyme [Planctomycetota bacterium]HQB01366.1 thiamine pyrophosphate-dependent enzyme [Planctomycetota bacterium]HRU52032.1 thiamine pyrophosphate-dependent enzyme [Planctomycetota bacterium]